MNIEGITEIENQVILWEILSGMRLSHLALDICITESTATGDKHRLMELYQTLVHLKAIELRSTVLCRVCDHVKSKESLLLTYFPSVDFVCYPVFIPWVYKMLLMDVRS